MYSAIKATRQIKLGSTSFLSSSVQSNAVRNYASSKKGGWNNNDNHMLPSQQFSEGSLDFSSGSQNSWQKNDSRNSMSGSDSWKNNKYNSNNSNSIQSEVPIDRKTNNSDPYRNLDKQFDGSRGSSKKDRNSSDSNSWQQQGNQQRNWENQNQQQEFKNSSYARGGSFDRSEMNREMSNNKDQPYWASQKDRQSKYDQSVERRFDRDHEGFSANKGSRNYDDGSFYNSKLDNDMNRAEKFRDDDYSASSSENFRSNQNYNDNNYQNNYQNNNRQNRDNNFSQYQNQSSWSQQNQNNNQGWNQNQNRDFSTFDEGSSMKRNRNDFESRKQSNRNMNNAEQSWKDPVYLSRGTSSNSNSDNWNDNYNNQRSDFSASQGNREYREQPWQQDQSKPAYQPSRGSEASGSRDHRQFDRDESNRDYYSASSGFASGSMASNRWNENQEPGLLDKTVDLLATGAHKVIEVGKNVAASQPVMNAREKISEGFHNLGEKVKESIGMKSENEETQSNNNYNNYNNYNNNNSSNSMRDDRVYYQPKRESLQDKASNKFEEIKETAKDAWKSGKSMANEAMREASDKSSSGQFSAKAAEAVENVKDFAKEKLESAKETAKDAWKSGKSMANEAMREASDKSSSGQFSAKAAETVENVKDFAKEKLENAKDKLSDMSAAASEKAERLSEKVKDKASEYSASAKTKASEFGSSFMNSEKKEIERDPNKARVALVNEAEKIKKGDYSASSSKTNLKEDDGNFTDFATNLGLIDRKEQPQTRAPKANETVDFKDASFNNYIKDSTMSNGSKSQKKETKDNESSSNEKKTLF